MMLQLPLVVWLMFDMSYCSAGWSAVLDECLTYTRLNKLLFSQCKFCACECRERLKILRGVPFARVRDDVSFAMW